MVRDLIARILLPLAAGLCLTTSAQAQGTDDWGRSGTTKDCRDNCRTFLVNFVVLSPVRIRDVEATMQQEIDILNRQFRTRKGYQLFEFVKKRVVPYEQVQATEGCRKLKALGHLRHTLDTGKHHGERRKAIAECFAATSEGARTLFDHHTINVYIFDNFDSNGSHGGALVARDKRWPFLFIDHTRLGHVAAVEEHEMGHAFAKLGHVCVRDANRRDATPIMASSHAWAGGKPDCRAHGGRAGDRSLGFSDTTASWREQDHREISQIVEAADAVQRALGAEGSPPPSTKPQW